MANAKPIGETAEGWPIWARNAVGQPICGYRKKASNGGGVCQQARGLGPSGRCCAPGHGGKQKSMAEAREIRSREVFLSALAKGQAEGCEDIVPELIKQLHAQVKAGNLEALKYVTNQLYGGPTTTIEHKITGTVVLEIVIRATAKRLEKADFGEWLSEVKSDMASASLN